LFREDCNRGTTNAKMARYDSYDMKRGYGIDIENSLIDDKEYIISREEKEQDKKNEEVLTHYINNSSSNEEDDKKSEEEKKKDISSSTTRRGRCQADDDTIASSRSQSRGRYTRSRSRNRSRGRSLTRGPFSNKNRTDDQSITSKKSTASAGAQLHLRSRSRDRSKTPSSGGERKSTIKFEYMLSMMRRRKNTTSSSTAEKTKEDKNDNKDDGDSANDDIKKAFKQFVPEHIGSCLISDLKSISKWNWMFTLNQILSGLSVMLTQVPECISYAYIAGVDPFHALQATWIANIISSIVGGRPGMICGSSGLGAVALRFLVSTHGPQYIFYAVILSGLCQVLFGALRLGKYLRLLPPGITIGLTNALACLVILLQLRYFKILPTMKEEGNNTVIADDGSITEDSLNQPWAYYMGYDLPWATSTSQIIILFLEALVTMIICLVLSKYISTVPASFVAIAFVSIVNMGIREGTDWVAPTVEDYYLGEVRNNEVYAFISFLFDIYTHIGTLCLPLLLSLQLQDFGVSFIRPTTCQQ